MRRPRQRAVLLAVVGLVAGGLMLTSAALTHSPAEPPPTQPDGVAQPAIRNVALPGKPFSYVSPAAQRLADVEPFADQPINPTDAPAATKALDEALAALQRTRKAGQLVAALKDVPLHAPPWPESENWGNVALTQAAAAGQRLDQWIAEQRKTDLPKIAGADEVFALLQKRRTQIDKEIEVMSVT